MNNRNNPQYLIATFAAVFGLFSYGFMRYIEDGSYSAWGEHTLIPFWVSMATAVLVIAEHMLLKKTEYMPFVVVSTVIAAMTIGAYISTEWEYYYLATLGMAGIMCLYGKFRPMILHQFINVVLNVFILCFLLNDAPHGYREHMINNFFLYLYAAIFLIIQFRRATKKASITQSGLQAFSSLLGSTPNLMVIVDGKRRVRYISAPLAKFAGMDETTAVGRPLVDLFKAESLKLMFADILDAENFYSATREIDMNDEPHYFKIIADKLSDSDEGMFIEITDMTEIVLASIEAEKSRKEAEAANKSKSNFLTTMSHEIRTPMNAIIGVSEIQLLRGDLPDDITKAFKQIHASSHGLLGIINDILDLSRIETGKLEINPVEYDIASLINDAVQLNIVRIGSKPIEFLLDLEDDLPARMIGDEMRLKQILNNILSNAFKYTDEGTVKLSVSNRFTENGIELIFIIADTGQGMKQEDLACLFEEYSRFNSSANRYTEGTGLGMNITQRLVNMMNGKIDVESEYGKGSTFTVTVLQQPSDNKAVVGKEHAEKLRNFTYTIDREVQRIIIKREHMPYGRVLIVDDVETNLYVARGLLTPYGLTIETASSGFEAIDKISGDAVYDIVFMDHMMPKMDGIETTRKLRASGYKGTIVALTANAIAGNDKLFKENGFEDFISKPIDIRQMNIVLNKYIRDKQSRETLEIAKAQMSIKPEITPAPVNADKRLLEIFKNDAKKAIVTLVKTADSGDYKLFAITAHAMKSAALNIGEEGISELAKSLECAGNESDKAFIDMHTSALINALTKIIGEDDVETSEVFEEDAALLFEKMQKIREACVAYDGGTARALLKELSERAWKAETSAVLDQISEMVLCSDFDEAAEKVYELCKHASRNL